MTQDEAIASAEAAQFADPEFFRAIRIRRHGANKADYVCVCYATEACYYVADTIEKVKNASRFMLDSVKRPNPT